MASLVLGNLGSSFLGPIGGFLGSAVGSFIDNAIFGATPADTEGPRLSDLQGIQADPGQVIAYVWGADRLAGTVVHTTDLIETKHKKDVGGKGGGKKQQAITYTYHVDIDYLLCEGPILGVGRIWSDGKLVRGTRYQMSLDTDENYEKIGGIPYNDYYKDNIIDPTVMPWSFEQDYTSTIEDQFYVWTVARGFIPVPDEVAETYLSDTLRVVYQYDTLSEIYVPVPTSHAYTGEIIAETDPEPTKVSQSGPVSPVQIFGFGDPDYNGAQDGDLSYFEFDISEALGAQAYQPLGSVRQDMGFVEIQATTGGTTNAEGTEEWVIASSVFVEAFHRNPVTGEETAYSGSSQSWITSGTTQVDNKVTLTMPLALGYTTVRGYVSAARAVPAFSTGGIYGISVEMETYIPVQAPEVRNWPNYYSFADAINDWSPKSVLEFHGPEGVALYRGTQDQISDPTMELVAPDGSGKVPAYRGRAHIVFQHFELADFGNRIPNLTFEIVQSDNARIVPILTDLMDRAGMDPTYYDLDALPTTGVASYVLGYSIATATSFRAAMEPLLEAFNIDAAEIGNQIIFRPKKREYDHTIDYSEIQAIDAGGKPETPIKLTLRDVIDMPKSIGVLYRDPEREYQVNTATFSRQVTPSVGATSLELAAVMPATVMKSYARDKMRDLWLERVSGSFTMPHKYIYVSPSDIIFINGSDYDKQDIVFKLTSVTRRDTGILEMEGVVQETTLYVPQVDETSNDAVDRTTYSPQSRPIYTLATRFIHMNLPALLPTHNDAGFYYAVTGTRTSWAGAAIYLDTGRPSFPNWQLQEVNQVGARMGKLRETKLNLVSNPEVVDFESEVTVYLYNLDEELESITGAAMLEGGNAALIGEEIVHFQNAVATDDGGWTLTNFLRGRRGTQRFATAAHTTNADFVLLTTNEITRVTRDYADAFNPTGTGWTPFEPYKALTFGASISGLGEPSEDDITTNETTRLLPFEPVRLASSEGVGGSVDITWERQDRLSFTLEEEGETPNSEVNHEFRITITANVANGAATSTRSTLTTSTTFEYTLAMQVEDAQIAGTPITFTVAQVSAVVGEGQVAEGILYVS
jgi:hypothetical protein